MHEGAIWLFYPQDQPVHWESYITYMSSPATATRCQCITGHFCEISLLTVVSFSKSLMMDMEKMTCFTTTGVSVFIMCLFRNKYILCQMWVSNGLTLIEFEDKSSHVSWASPSMPSIVPMLFLDKLRTVRELSICKPPMWTMWLLTADSYEWMFKKQNTYKLIHFSSLSWYQKYIKSIWPCRPK